MQFKNTFTLVFIFAIFPFSFGIAKENPQRNIYCHTPAEEKIFILTPHSVFFQESPFIRLQREIASSTIHSASLKDPKKLLDSTSVNVDGFTASVIQKLFSLDGVEYKIYIHNVKNFMEEEDYITMISRRGYRMSYSLKCRWQDTMGVGDKVSVN